MSRAVEIFREARKSDPNAFLFPEALVNQAAYERIGAGAAREAIELCRLNAEAYPASANAYDSLAEAYMTSGSKRLAIRNYEQSLKLNPKNENAVAMLKKLRGEK